MNRRDATHVNDPPKALAAVVLAVGLLACTNVSAEPAEGGAVQVDGSAVSVAAVSEHVWQLASDGQLEAALDQVRDLTADAEAGSPLSALQSDVNAHEAHVRAGLEKAAAAYDRHMAKLAEQIEQGKLADALVSAVRAHDVALDPEALLDEAKVSELVSKSERQASEHEQAGRWLKALSLYRGLAALYENTDRDRYAEPLRRVAGRVGLLRLYAPRVLFDLYKQHAAEEGEDEPTPWNFEEDNWETQLENITFPMVVEAMNLAAENHVETSGYEQLMLGGIDALKVLLSTAGLEAAFPSLGNAEAVKKFSDCLTDIEEQVKGRDVPMREGDAETMLRKVQADNAGTVALPERVVLREFGDGAMGKLDEFSGFIWPHTKEMFERTTTQKFSGVGIQISLVDRGRAVTPDKLIDQGKDEAPPTARNQLTVVTPLEGSPAHKAGIHPGDRIVTIDGKSTVGIDLDTAVDKITGPEGTEVTLGIESPNSDQVRNITLKRASIQITSIKGWSRPVEGGWDYYIDPEFKIGYVRMTTFGPDTADELDSAVMSMLNGKGLHGLILDLRFNPGGRLDAAINVGDRFLERGVIVSTTQKMITGRPWIAMATAPKTYPDFPLIVLVNRGSASASEIVGGALKDHDRALLVGQRSFGKGSVQNLFPIGDKNAYLKLTTQYYRLPDGKIIHRREGQTDWGVDPDVEVRMTDQQTVNALQARTLLDILRSQDDAFDPKHVINTPRFDDDDEPEQDPLPPIDSADDILTQGLDPQLETSLLLLKTKIIGEEKS